MTEDEVFDAVCVPRDRLIRIFHPMLVGLGISRIDTLVSGPIDRMRQSQHSKVSRAEVSIYQALRAEAGPGHD